MATTKRISLFGILWSAILLHLASDLAAVSGHQDQDNDKSKMIKLSSEGAALNYLLFSSDKQRNDFLADEQLVSKNSSIKRIDDILRDENHSHVSKTVDLKLAKFVWQHMRQNTMDFVRQKTREARPPINRLLDQARVSSGCRRSLNGVLDHIEKLDSWAIQRIFEGSLTSMGSYHQCVDLVENDVIGKPQYCTYKFQPVVPQRPKFHIILAPVEGLANFTSQGDMFYDLANKAQYFYYTKLRLATCMPSKCDRNDLELLGKQVALNAFIQYSGVSCLEKEVGYNLDGVQIFALTILVSLASISLVGTLVHILNLSSYFAHKPRVSKNSSVDLNGDNQNQNHNHNDHRLYQKNQVALQQQSLLANNQQKSSILSPPIIPASESSVFLGSGSSSGSRGSLILRTIDFLMHFSLIKNARKLFDTSTSRSKVSGGDVVPNHCNELEMKGHSGDSGSRNGSQSDSSSINIPGKCNDISCVHGLRFWTISWIVFGHTIQYNEWGAFARAYQVEQNISAFFIQPLLNATFSVDTFFLISGLLTTYVTWSITKGQYKRFNKFAFLISRYLRLTPQVLLVVLIFIIFPIMGDGPYWRGLIQKQSDNCKRNWWINALYLQAFVDQDHICNLVTWWLSIEMFFHFVSIVVIVALLKDTRRGIWTALLVFGSMTFYSGYLHYINNYPPVMMPTLLQRYEVWESVVLRHFWTPFPHAPAYFVGLLLGYILYSKCIRQLSKLEVTLCWLAFAVTFVLILFGTYGWNKNEPYTIIASTAYSIFARIFWSLATGWVIFACANGHGGWLNEFLSSSVFIVLGRATYMTYLSHMIIVYSYPAKMNLLIEPSYLVFSYIFITNLCLSYALGIMLTLVYESPILHLQKFLVTSMAMKFNEENPKINSAKEEEKIVRVSLYEPQVIQIADENDK